MIDCTVHTTPEPLPAPTDIEAWGEVGPHRGDAAIASFAEDEAYDFKADYLALTAGMSTVETTGAPSLLVLHGPTAFPVVVDESKRPFIAAARVGQGKVLVTGHESYLYATTGDSKKLVVNAAAWMAPAGSTVGIDPSLATVAATFSGAGYVTKTIPPSDIGTVSIYVVRPYGTYTEQELEGIRQFVRNGGNLIVGGHAWYWAYTNPDKSILSAPVNKMLLDAGILVTGSSGISAGTDTVSQTPLPDLLNAWIAIDKLSAHAANAAPLPVEDVKLAIAVVEQAMTHVPLVYTPFYDHLSSFASSINFVITVAAPLKRDIQLVEAFSVRLLNKYAQELPPNQIEVNPSATNFPGVVPTSAARETISVVVNGDSTGRDLRFTAAGPSRPAWNSTGAYAPPGEVIKVRVPPAFIGAKLLVQIGAHTDTLWHKTSWYRSPQIVRTYALNAEEIQIASAFGGLIYVTVPRGSSVGPVPVAIEGAVRAPCYVHGTTTNAEWLAIRNHPAPWAELISRNMILTVPSAGIRTLNDPAAVMSLWDKAMDAAADLASIPRERERAERFVFDCDISAGYMHAGYPLMGPVGEVPTVVTPAKLASSAGWGQAHEVGHNHQWSDWRFDGTVESTVNLWSVYIMENVFGVLRSNAHSAIAPAKRQQRIQSFIAGGRQHATWVADAWLALELYLQLQEAFGWEPYKSIFADYYAIPSTSGPKTNQEKINEWVRRFSEKVGKNLGPFFTNWGFPVSQAVLDTIAVLPAWAENPMK
jgi:hypothetical protein